MEPDPDRLDVCVVGGCGHVGLPLALSFADRGLRVGIHDIDEHAVELVRSGRMPFRETGADEVLTRVVGRGLEVTTDPAIIKRAEHVVVVIGTPVDEHLNPTFHSMKRFFERLAPDLADGQCVILRSTVFPGTTAKVRDLMARLGRRVHVAFCPERVAEGKAMTELVALPQIVSGCDDRAIAMAESLFKNLAASTIRLEPLEAELTKIFANVWRYIQFATANQFFMIAADHGLDFYKIYDALTRDYPRMSGLPKAGFAAGPCLFKDTMQLSAAYDNHFALGHAAMLINEGLPNFLARKLRAKYPLDSMRVGILGMAFKAESDDPRESLSFKLRKVLEYEAIEVFCTDEYVRDPSFLPLAEVVERSDLLVVGAPHRAYRDLAVPEGKPVVDIWDLYGRGALLS